MTDTPSISNVGEYLSAHYLAEVLPGVLRKGRVPEWQKAEKAHAARTVDGLPVSPRAGLRDLGRAYFAAKTDVLDLVPGTPELAEAVHALHLRVLTALGFRAEPGDLDRVRSDHPHTVPVLHHEPGIVAIEGGWATDPDACLDPGDPEDAGAPVGAGRLPEPVILRGAQGKEEITDVRHLVAHLFATVDPPSYVLVLTGGVITLADRTAWGEGRRLSVSLESLYGRNDSAEIDVAAHLLHAETLRPPTAGGAPALAGIVDGSRQHAVGVSAELREGLRTSVELVANEVLTRLREQGLNAEQTDDPKALGARLRKESLRYLYRILFLLYAEARPDLGVLPVDAPEYTAGYGMGRLGDLVAKPLGPNSGAGFHLYESLDLLFRLVDQGHDGVRGGSGIGLTFEALRSDLFLPGSIGLIGGEVIDPDYAADDPDAPRYDTRLRDRCLYTVLRKLMLASGGRKGRGGFISYAQLGINQLGAVYEGLMSYTGTIAAEELLEVAKNGERDGDKDGSWLIPASKADQYPDSAFVSDPDPETGVRSRRRHETGSFVFRLAGRDRATSASYYTPESLTRTVVQLTLAERLDQDGVVTRAAEMLDWTICEPALGSGAFLNEAINQVAAEYLRRRQAELGETIPDEDYRIELQRTKAYLALHNCYGVDLNDTAVELAEVSVWLNVMHKGLQAPWLGLHLRRGDSLIGCTRTTYTHAQVTTATWANETPERLPLTERELPDGRVHQFLLPSSGWGVAATTKEAKELDGERAKRLSAWRRTMLRKPTEAQARRLTALAVRVEQLWELVRARVELSEQQVRRDLPVWGAERRSAVAAIRTREQVRADLFRVGSPYWRLKTLMDVWCALWFTPTHLVDTFASIEALILPPTPLPAIPPDDAPAPLPQPQQSGSPALRTAPGQGALISDLELTGVEELTLFDSLGLVDAQKVQEAEERDRRREERRLAKERKALSAVSTVPLTSLGDWLDFAEALLGVKDKPSKKGENLLQQFTSLDDLDAYENTIPVRFRCLEPTQIATRFPWLQPLQEIAADRGFFHWDLDFVRPMSSGGFDLQVGNPPWVRPDWDERLVLAENDPWFGLIEKPDRGEWDRHRKRLLSSETTTDEYLQESALVAGCSNSLSHSTTYPLITGTRPNLYRAFMCRAWANQHRQGTTGLLHPDTHFNGSKEAPLRSASYRHLRIHADFVNSSHRFFPPPIGHSTHIGLQIYGYPHDPDFVHLSWILDPNTLIESILAYRNGHPGASELIPGVKFEGDWDIRPHPSRVVRATLDTLRHWQSVLGDKGDPSSARLLNPLTTHEEEVLAILANYPDRLSASNPAVTNGFDEGLAKRTRLIQWQPSKPSDWEDVVLKGPQIGVATPILKSPIENEGSRPTDLMTLPADYVPPTPYRRICSKEQFEKSQDQWHDMDGTTRKSSDFFRAAWRCQIASDTDRSLFMALIPRSVSHVDGLQSGRLANTQLTALWSGMWSTLPIDYLLRVMGSSHLRLSNARAMPAPRSDHPLAPALLLRTMRMNCLTTAWSPLWEELYRPSWQSDSWAFEWPGTQDLQTIGPQWNVGTPLRSDRERRAALVEMDALVAVWLGLTASQLISIYLSRFPVLNQYESAMWFSSSGCRLSPHHNIYGAGQTKEHWGQLQAYLEDPASNPPPEGFPPPYYKADRVAEMRQAHEVFTKRLAAGSSAALDDERAPSGPAKTRAKSVEAGR